MMTTFWNVFCNVSGHKKSTVAGKKEKKIISQIELIIIQDMKVRATANDLHFYWGLKFNAVIRTHV